MKTRTIVLAALMLGCGTNGAVSEPTTETAEAVIRTDGIYIHLTTAEKDQILAASTRAGETTGKWARSILLRTATFAAGLATDAGAGDGGTCTADTQNDALNCGYCGHSCQGGTCSAGVCQQVTLASGLNEPSYLAVRGATATWTDFTNGDVLGMSTWGGSPATFLTGQATPSGLACIPVGNTIASNATTTFWTDGSSIKSGPTPCDPAGGCTPTVLASGLSWARALTIDATTVYFTSMDSILSVPLGGGAISTLASGQNGPWSLATGRPTMAPSRASPLRAAR